MRTQMPTFYPEILIEDRPHHFAGPSSFDMVEACTASADPSAVRVDRSNSYAEEGTVAHALLEETLRRPGVETYEFMGARAGERSAPVLGTIDMEMVEYIDPVVEMFRQEFDHGFEVEVKLELPDVGLFGYTDVIGYRFGRRTVADLKYGMLWVDASSTQTGIYILMDAVRRGLDLEAMPPDEVVADAMIIQPRIDPKPRTYSWTAGALVDLHVRVRAVFRELEVGHYRFKAGQHCRWCSRGPVCPYMKALVVDAALTRTLPDPEDIINNRFDVNDLDAAFGIVLAVEKWTKSVRELGARYVQNGGALPSAKLVKGRSSRDWSDPVGMQAYMREHGVDPMELPKLLTPAKAEKTIPKHAKKGLTRFQSKTEGALTVKHVDEQGTAVQPGEALRNAELQRIARNTLAKPKNATDGETK